MYIFMLDNKYHFFSHFRDLCLKTVERFINHKDKCNFDLSTALDILQDGICLMYFCYCRIIFRFFFVKNGTLRIVE